MKKLAFILFVSLMSACAVAPKNFCKDSTAVTIPKNEDGRFYYSEVISAEGSDKELYVKCLKWVNTYYRSAKSVTQVADSENKLIITQGLWTISIISTTGSTNAGDTHTFVMADITHNITIECKDGKVRCEVQKFILESDAVYSSGRLVSPSSRIMAENMQIGVGTTGCVYEKIDTETKDIFKSLAAFINKKSDW